MGRPLFSLHKHIPMLALSRPLPAPACTTTHCTLASLASSTMLLCHTQYPSTPMMRSCFDNPTPVIPLHPAPAFVCTRTSRLRGMHVMWIQSPMLCMFLSLSLDVLLTMVFTLPPVVNTKLPSLPSVLLHTRHSHMLYVSVSMHC